MSKPEEHNILPAEELVFEDGFSRGGAVYHSRWSFSLHSQGNFLITVSPPEDTDGLRLWSFPDLTLQSYWSPGGYVVDAKFSSDGQRLFTVGAGGVELWDCSGLSDGHWPPERLAGLQGDQAVFSPNSEFLAFRYAEELTVAETRTGKVTKVLPYSRDFAFSDCGNHLMLSQDGIRVVSLKDQEEWTLATETSPICMALSADGRWIAATLFNQDDFLLWETSTKEVRKFAGSRGRHGKVSFSPDSRWFLCGVDMARPLVLCLETGKQMALPSTPNKNVSYSSEFWTWSEPDLFVGSDEKGHAFSWRFKKKRSFFSTSYDVQLERSQGVGDVIGMVKDHIFHFMESSEALQSRRTKRPSADTSFPIRNSLQVPSSRMMSLLQRRYLEVYQDEQYLVWDILKAKLIWEAPSPPSIVHQHCLGIHNDKLRVESLLTEADLSLELPQHFEHPEKAYFDCDSKAERIVCLHSGSAYLRLDERWVSLGDSQQGSSHAVQAIRFSKNENRLVLWGRYNPRDFYESLTYSVWDAQTGEFQSKGSAKSIAIFSDGELATVNSEGLMVRGQPVEIQGVEYATISPDEKWLIGWGETGVKRLDPSTHRSHQIDDERPSKGVFFSECGRWLVLASRALVRVFDTTSWELITEHRCSAPDMIRVGFGAVYLHSEVRVKACSLPNGEWIDMPNPAQPASHTAFVPLAGRRCLLWSASHPIVYLLSVEGAEILGSLQLTRPRGYLVRANDGRFDATHGNLDRIQIRERLTLRALDRSPTPGLWQELVEGKS